MRSSRCRGDREHGLQQRPWILLVGLVMLACQPVTRVNPATPASQLVSSGAPTPSPDDAVSLENPDEEGALVGGNMVTLLWDGPQTVASMKDAIRHATSHINIETFIIRDDEVGRPLADLLLQKQAEGVQVNLIYDSYGAMRTPDEFFERLRAGGIHVLEFNPVNPVDKIESGVRTDGLTINNRNHRKLMVIDGRIGFTGGINFHREYSNSSSAVIFDQKREEPRYFWRDTHVRIEGPVVAEMQKSFIEMWTRHSPEKLPPADYFPELEPKGNDRVRITIGSPRQDVSDVYAAYISAIQAASRTVHLTHAYLVPTDELLESLTTAARRGVEVKLVLPGFSDFWMPRFAGRYYYKDLLKSGVKIYERQGAMLHAKAGVIDGIWSTVGSSNLDSRSTLHDAEVNAIILGPDFARQMEEMFRFDIDHSQEVLLSDWENRPLSERVREWVARVFKYWL
jgi:cardiolipin synthase